MILLYGAIYFIRTIWFRPDNIHYYFLRFPYSYAQVFPEEASVVEIPQANLLSPYQSYLNNVPSPPFSPTTFWSNVETTLEGYRENELSEEEVFHQKNLLWVSQHLKDSAVRQMETPSFHPHAGIERELIHLLDVIQQVGNPNEAEYFLSRLKRFDTKVDLYLERVPLAFRDSLSQYLYVKHLEELIDLPIENHPIYRAFARKAIAADPTQLNESEAARLLGEVSRELAGAFKRSLQRILDRVLEQSLSTNYPESRSSGLSYAQSLTYYTSLNLDPDSLHEASLSALDSLISLDTLNLSEKKDVEIEPENFLDSLRNMQAYVRQVSSGLFELPIQAPLEIQFSHVSEKNLPLWAGYEFVLDSEKGRGLLLVPRDSSFQIPLGHWLPYLCYIGIPGIHSLNAAQWNEATTPYIHRQFLSFPSFEQGWGLYSVATLQQEIGIFSQNTQAYQGYLTLLKEAVSRVIVDTGIHTQGWSFLEASKFMNTHSKLSQDEIHKEILCIFRRPGYFSTPWVGFQAFMKVRWEEEAQLGDEFYLQDFHARILRVGPGTFSAFRQRGR
ncbi:MAG: DUF885 family protein [Bacteroidota bacterium]